MNPIEQFEAECASRIASYRDADHAELRRLSELWLREAYRSKYMYHFKSYGRPVIQLPQDMIAIQEILWRVQPDLVIETGIAHGGSLVMHAGTLEVIGDGEVLGVDIDIRAHNREAIEEHSLSSRITMFEGSSVDPTMIERVREFAAAHETVLVILDSNHTHAHVLAELEAYAPLVTRGSYCIVLDTIVEYLPADTFPDRPWSPGDSPATAVAEYLQRDLGLDVDREFDDKLLLSCAPGGYLRRSGSAS